MAETYTLDTFCQNCDFEGSVNIEKGNEVNNHECPKCGTKMLKKVTKIVTLKPHVEDYS